MNTLNSLIAAVVTSLCVSTIVLVAITNPLRRVIASFCRNEEATPFWTQFTILMLYAAPMLSALWWTPVFPDVFSVMRGALAATLFGVIGGLTIIGFKVAGAKTA